MKTTTLDLPTTDTNTTLKFADDPATLNLIVPRVSSGQAPALIDAKPLPPPAQPRKIRRNGRVASLPRLQRDMVNRMLWNAVPYKNIVAALDETGYTVTERNISNLATGGYLEWGFEQEHVLQNRLDQDYLLDFLRRDDAPELPEVGLQAAATRLSQVLLFPTRMNNWMLGVGFWNLALCAPTVLFYFLRIQRTNVLRFA